LATFEDTSQQPYQLNALDVTFSLMIVNRFFLKNNDIPPFYLRTQKSMGLPERGVTFTSYCLLTTRQYNIVSQCRFGYYD